MRVVLVSEYFPPAVLGGAEVSTREQALALARAGHDVVVVTPNYGGEDHEAWPSNLRVERFAFPARLSPGRSVRSILFQNPVFYLYLAWAVFREARRADVVHAQNSFSLVGAFVGARLAGKRFVVTLRDYMHLCSAGAICLHDRELPPHRCRLTQYARCLRDFKKAYEPNQSLPKRVRGLVRNAVETVDVKARQFALARADAVVTVSDAVGAIYSASGLVRVAPETIYNRPPRLTPSTSKASLRERHGIASEAPIVLYVGKQSFGKGTDVLISAFPRVLEVVPDAVLVLAGRSSSLLSIPEHGKVIATGALPHEDVLALYAEADVVVLPAVWKEPYPRSLLEAMAAGRPVVATRVGGIPELVEDGVTGILVPPKDEAALADAIVNLLRDPQRAQALGAAARRHIDALSADSTPETHLETIYKGQARTTN